MAKVLINEENLTNIANAIREKSESTDSYKPSEMVTAIQNISSGGGDPELEASFISRINNTEGANITKLPSEITSIRKKAFYNHKDVALTKLPSGLTSIGENAFNGCSNLALTELPSRLINIGSEAFSNCAKLALTKLPSGLTSLSMGVFKNCINLNNLNIVGLMTSIYSNVFNGCTNLTKISFPNITNVISLLSATAFNSTPIANGTGYIYVPDDLVDSFKSATNWSTYADQIKPISELEVNE